MSKTIPTAYSKNGWNYRLLLREGDYAIYGQGGTSAYELVHVRSRGASSYVAAGKAVTIEAGEYLPNTNEWGRHGWTYHTRDEAVDAMCRKIKEASK